MTDDALASVRRLNTKTSCSGVILITGASGRVARRTASPIMWLPRKNPNSLKQHGRGDVVGMGDKRDRHPAADGLIFRADLPRVPASPVGEDESTGDRQQEGEANSHSAPPRFSHDSI